MISSCSDACGCMLHASVTCFCYIYLCLPYNNIPALSLTIQIALVKDGIIAQAKVGEDSYNGYNYTPLH